MISIKTPNCCNDCDFCASCGTGMFMDGCTFYPPGSKSLSFIQRIKQIFKVLSRV